MVRSVILILTILPLTALAQEGDCGDLKYRNAMIDDCNDKGDPLNESCTICRDAIENDSRVALGVLPEPRSHRAPDYRQPEILDEPEVREAAVVRPRPVGRKSFLDKLLE